MSGAKIEARTFQLTDIPLMHRLKTRGISLDSESYLARGLHTLEDAALSRLPVARLGAPTLVVRHGRTEAVGQYRHAPGEPDARIMFIAPTFNQRSIAPRSIAPRSAAPRTETALETAWLHLLDALAAAAGHGGAHTLHAEVDENSRVFEVLRQAGYAAYARQDIWRRDPAALPTVPPALYLRRASQADLPMIRWFYSQHVPSLVQQANPSPPAGGLLYMERDTVLGYVAVSEGQRGIYLKPYLLPETIHEQEALIQSVLLHLPRAARLPIYCAVRRYQSDLSGPLERFDFRPWVRQAVMVKHTSVRVKQVTFETVPSLSGGIIAGNSHDCRRQARAESWPLLCQVDETPDPSPGAGPALFN